MQYLARMLCLLLVLALFGCGGENRSSNPTGGGGGPSTTPPPPVQNSATNWQFSTTSAVSEMPALTISGSVGRSGSAISAKFHVDGSNCFDPLSTVTLTGTLTNDDLSLTSNSVAGQVTTFTGRVTHDALAGWSSPGQFTGTYTISGGCANGDQGSVIGIKLPFINHLVTGTLMASGGGTFHLEGDMTLQGAISEGSFGITGSVAFDTPCFGPSEIKSGVFRSGSYILGTSVALVFETGNGTIAFLGTLDPDKSEISGTYTASGSTCDQTGTALLVLVPNR
jgi:hypothetical protein